MKNSSQMPQFWGLTMGLFKTLGNLLKSQSEKTLKKSFSSYWTPSHVGKKKMVGYSSKINYEMLEKQKQNLF